MKRRLILVALDLAVLLALAVGVVRAADPPPAMYPPQQNPDQFQYNGASLDLYNPFSGPLRETGEWHWYFQRNTACVGNVEQYVRLALADLGQTYAINFIEDPVRGHLIYQNCGPALVGRCGATNINCLGRGYPYDVTIDLSSDLATYFEVSSVAVVEHEMLHAMATYDEQYVKDGTFRASQDVTVMNTGPLSRHYQQQADRDRWNRTMGPRTVKSYGRGANAGGEYVYWCALDPVATRVAVLYDDGGVVYWSGIQVPARLANGQPNVDANGCRGQIVYTWPGRRCGIKAETAVSWRTSETVAWVDCSS